MTQAGLAAAATASTAMLGYSMLQSNDALNPALQKQVVVFAAASLGEAMQEIKRLFEKTHPGLDLVFSTAGSQILAAQIMQGAPADVFVSADWIQMNRVGNAVVAPETLVTNRMVLVIRKQVLGALADDNADAIDLATVVARCRKIVLAGNTVPAGIYSVQCLTSLGLWDEVQSRVVSYEDSVVGVLGKVLLGDADSGVVYATDVRSLDDPEICVIDLPEHESDAIAYAVGRVLVSKNSASAEAFVQFLKSPECKEILDRHGFGGL